MKDRATESRFDFAGGVNYSPTGDGLRQNELLLCTNARINVGGDVQRRSGTRKMNTGSLLGSALTPMVVGLAHWYGAAGTGFEYMAVANAKFYTSPDLATWTEKAVLSAPTGYNPSFFVEMASGANTIIYFTAGLRLWSWDGTNVVDLTTTVGAPPANVVAVFGDRLFCNNTSDPQTLYWSALGNGGDFAEAGLSGGGFATLPVSEGDSITALVVLGSSLLIATRETIARFTGTADDIQILTDTEGVSADIGPMTVSRSYPGQGGFQRVEQAIYMMTERGPYLVNEGGIMSMAAKLQTTRTDVKWLPRSRPFVGHNVARNEVWFVYRAEVDGDVSGSGGFNYGSTAMVWNTMMKTFSGPYDLPAEVSTLAVLPHPTTRRPTLYGGFGDRLVRVMDDADQSRDAAGEDYTHTIQFAPFIFDSAGPHNTKKIRHIYVQLQRESATTVPVVKIYPDNGTAETAVLVRDDGVVNAPANLRYDVDSEGKRFVVEISGAYANGADGDNPRIIGVVVDGSVMNRW